MRKVSLISGAHPAQSMKTRFPMEHKVLYYTSCWDCVGMKFEIVGIDPNCLHPKPRPSTPQDLFDISIVLYQEGKLSKPPDVK